MGPEWTWDGAVQQERETMTTLINPQRDAAEDESKTKDAHEVVFMIAIKFSGEEEG